MSGIAVLLALAAAMLFAVGAVAQQQEAARVDAHGASFVRNLLSSPRWWAATFGDLVGYGLQAVALGLGSILVVQPLLIAALVFALPLSARWNARPIHRADMLWAGAIAAALATFLLVGDPGGGVDTNDFRGWLPSLIGCGVLSLAGLAVAARSPRGRGIGLAIVAGTVFGLASALTKSVAHLVGQDPAQLLSSWEAYALVACGGIGLLCQQLAFQAGSIEISFPAAMVLDPVVSVIVGIAALDERVHADGAEWILIVMSALVMVSGTIALARAGAPTSPTGTAASTTPPSPQPAA